jgi:hypothetical protein
MRKSLLALVLAACGSARIIQMTPAGGIIELQGDRSKAMEQATSDMNAKCGPSNFTIVQEGEEPVGTQTVQQDQPNPGAPPTATSTTSNVVAWRIHFQCNGAIGGAPPLDQPAIASPGPPGAPPTTAADPTPPPSTPPPGY